MDLSTSTALVTGANRGLGRALAAELLSRGASVYAAARNPEQLDLAGAKPIALDITDPASVATAAAATGDVTVLINNAAFPPEPTCSQGIWTTSAWRWTPTTTARSRPSGPSRRRSRTTAAVRS
jgi:NAD(P)-dependent dehydrogenase (short-subunit alcohol dehydrogenase family)